MKLPSQNWLIFNGIASLLIIAGIIALFRSIFILDSIEPCSERYHTQTQFTAIDENGAPLSPGAMQGQMDGKEWGVIDNLTVLRSDDAPGNIALRIALSPDKSHSDTSGSDVSETKTGGAGFTWLPGFLSTRPSACLSYGLLVPTKFQFGTGGLLPGLYGGANAASSPLKDSFATRLHWDRDGKSGIRIEKGLNRFRSKEWKNFGAFDLPKGRWLQIEQEVTLNTANKKDGILRVWVDNKLVLERTSIGYRRQANSHLIGVLADTRYQTSALSNKIKPGQAIQLTPFTVRWN